MKKSVLFEGKIYLDKYNRLQFATRGFGFTKEELGRVFLRGRKEARLILKAESATSLWTTSEQRAYLFGHLGILARNLLVEKYAWNHVESVHDAITEFKIPLGFCEEDREGNKIPLSLSDKAKTDRGDVSQFIDNLFITLAEEGMRPLTPTDYRKFKKWREI